MSAVPGRVTVLPVESILRALRRGTHVPEQVELVGRGEALYAAEHVPCSANVRALSMPGALANRSVSLRAGSIVLTRSLVTASLSSRLLLVSVPWRPLGTEEHGHVQVHPEGVRVWFDIGRVLPGSSGELWYDYHCDIPADLLQAAPLHTAPLWITPEMLLALVRDND